MATIGRLSDTLTIRVYDERESIIEPHFHLTKGRDGTFNFQTCLCIKYNKYYFHTIKGQIIKEKSMKLSKRQLKEIDSFLREKDELGISNWQILLRQWNLENSGSFHKLSLNLPQPDFKKLNGSIIEI